MIWIVVGGVLLIIGAYFYGVSVGRKDEELSSRRRVAEADEIRLKEIDHIRAKYAELRRRTNRNLSGDFILLEESGLPVIVKAPKAG